RKPSSTRSTRRGDSISMDRHCSAYRSRESDHLIRWSNSRPASRLHLQHTGPPVPAWDLAWELQDSLLLTVSDPVLTISQSTVRITMPRTSAYVVRDLSR